MTSHMTGNGNAVRVLVVSRDSAAQRQVWWIGRENGWHLQSAENAWEAFEQAHAHSALDLLFLDISHDISNGDVNGMRTFRWLRKRSPALPVILLSNCDDMEQKQEASDLGAEAFLVKPIDHEVIREIIQKGIGTGSRDKAMNTASHDVEQVGEESFFVAAGPAMRKVRAQAELLAQVNVPVLIVGEGGSGKEIAARLIHQHSARSSGKFLTVSCAALPPEMLEQELFGQETGARGQQRARLGKLELGENGTLLLNEVTEMPMSLQSRLLRVLQERQIVRVGGEVALPVNVRVLAATNMTIDQTLAQKKLRDDLYYQLSAFTIQVPPLRQRREEIPILLSHFMHRLASAYGLQKRSFSPVVLAACQTHGWPGNLRELENFVKRYLVIGDEELALGELEKGREDAALQNWKLSETGPVADDATPAAESLPDLKSLVQDAKGFAERSAIAAALGKTHWNRKAAARLLRVSYRSLLYKIDQYHMSPPPYLSAFSANHGAKNNGHGR